MSTYSEILNAALTLSPHERAALAEVLWESADEHADASEISPAWREEIARRSAEVAAGTAQYTSYEQMRERARRAAGHDD